MNFSGAKTAVSAYKKILYGVGGIFSAAECALVLLYLPFTASLGLSDGVLIPVSVLGLGLPVLLVPFLYNRINGAMSVSTGRYHLPLAVSSLAASLCCVLLFSVRGFSGAVSALFVFLLLFGFSLAMQAYLYAYYGIGSRLDGSGRALGLKSFFLGLGALGVAAAYLTLYDGTTERLTNIVYAVSAVAVLAALCAYLGTYTSIPSFIRVEPATKRSFSGKFLKLFGWLRVRSLSLAFIGSTAVLCGLLTAVLSLPVLLAAIGLGRFTLHARLAGGAAVAVLAVLAPLAYRLLGNRSPLLSAYAAAGSGGIFLAALAAYAVLLFAPVPEFVRTVLVYAAAVAAGIGAAVPFAAEPVLRGYFCGRAGCSAGNGYVLRNVLLFLAAAAAAGLSLGARLLSDSLGVRTAATAAACVSGAAVLAGILLWRCSLLPVRNKKRREPIADLPATVQNTGVMPAVGPDSGVLPASDGKPEGDIPHV